MSDGTQEQMEIQMPKHGTLCWTEIATTDLEASVSFYSEMFGWKVSKSQNDEIPMDYREYDTGMGHPSGGMYQLSPDMTVGDEPMPPPHFMNYISVDDIEASVAKVTELGGTVMGELHDIPKVGRMAVVNDPAGATFAMLQFILG